MILTDLFNGIKNCGRKFHKSFIFITQMLFIGGRARVIDQKEFRFKLVLELQQFLQSYFDLD